MEERGLLRNSHNQFGGGCGTFLVIERKKGDGTMLIIDGAYADKAPVDARKKMIVDDIYNNRNARVYKETAPTIRAEREGLKVVEEKTCQVRVIGKMDHTMDNTFESANRVYDKDGLCPTIPTCGGGNIQPKVIEKTECVGGLSDNKWGTQFHQQDRVYKGDIAMALPANIPQGSYKYIVAMRGRGEKNEQRLEPNVSGTTNSLTTVQKDNLILEKETQSIEIKQATKGGDIDETKYRIRKLTPRECWRLMGYTDEDFDKAKGAGVSNSQLYKQAGNAIVKQVLMGIFSQMISPK